MAYLRLEAESVDSLGGWIIDQQSSGQMESAYTRAHGLGIPVTDAETQTRIPETGQWTVWIRTRDWTAVWKRGTPAGTSQVRVGKQILPTILGTKPNRSAPAPTTGASTPPTRSRFGVSTRKDVKNLFLGGRHIGATHVAFSCLRVMRTLGTRGVSHRGVHPALDARPEET